MSAPTRRSLWTYGKEPLSFWHSIELTYHIRGTRFVLSRDELLTLPEFVLLSLFPNGLFPEGHMGGSTEGDAVQVDVSSVLRGLSDIGKELGIY